MRETLRERVNETRRDLVQQARNLVKNLNDSDLAYISEQIIACNPSKIKNDYLSLFEESVRELEYFENEGENYE